MMGVPWNTELEKLRRRQEIEKDSDVIKPNIRERNEKFKNDVPILLSAFKGLRRARAIDGFLNEATLRLPMDILLHLVWSECETSLPSYLYLCV